MWVHRHPHRELYTSCIRRDTHIDRDTQTCTYTELFRVLHKDNTHFQYARAKTGTRRNVSEHKYTIYTRLVIIQYLLNTHSLLVMLRQREAPLNTSHTYTEIQALSEEPLGIIIWGPVSKPKMKNCFSVDGHQPMVEKITKCRRSIIYNRRKS